MKIKKLSVYLFALLSFIFIFSLSSTNASASTWHKGIPSMLKGDWRSGYETKNTYSRAQKVPVKFVVMIDKSTLGYTVLRKLQHKYPANMGFPTSYKYNQVTNDAIGSVDMPKYRMSSHGRYFIKSSAKFNKESPNRSVYFIKKYGKKMIKIWTKGNKYEPAFHKWTYLGEFNRIHGDILE